MSATEDWKRLPFYAGPWKPLIVGTKVRVRELWKDEPVMTVLGTLNEEPFDLTGTQFWRLKADDGLEYLAARAHLSTKLVRTSFKKSRTNPSHD